jgi:transcriptional regulator of acetoin/glycerol metabolism
VRELEHALASALVFVHEGVVELSDFPIPVRARPVVTPTTTTAPPERSLSETDARLCEALLQALTAHGGNVSVVAREMGRTRMQIHRWMRRFGIDPDHYRRAV